MTALLVLVFLCLAASSLSPSVQLDLGGNYSELFFWYVSVTVFGVPFTATVDTGSSDFLIPQLGCASCFGGDPQTYYNRTSETAVSCGAPLHCSSCLPACNFSVTYGGSLTENATAVRDSVYLGGAWKGQVVFGATYNVVQPQRRKRQQMADYPEGILGLAFSAENSLGTATLIDTLAAQNGLPNVFSLCFEPVGGKMIVGGFPQQLRWQFVPVYKPQFWQVQFEGVVMAGSVSLGPSSLFNAPGIVDSGTPFVTLPTPAFELMRSQLTANCSSNPLVGLCGVSPANNTLFDGACVTATEAEINAWPILTMQLVGGVQLRLRPHMYLMSMYSCQPGQVGLAIVPDPTFTIIAGNMLLHFDTVFDKEKMRVGFYEKRAGERC